MASTSFIRQDAPEVLFWKPDGLQKQVAQNITLQDTIERNTRLIATTTHRKCQKQLILPPNEVDHMG